MTKQTIAAKFEPKASIVNCFSHLYGVAPTALVLNLQWGLQAHNGRYKIDWAIQSIVVLN